MFFQIFVVVISAQLIQSRRSDLNENCSSSVCTNSILDATIALIEKGSNLNKNCNEMNGANCIFDIAVDLINKAKSGVCITNRTIQAVDCEELLLAGFNKSGNYTIWPKSRVNEAQSLNVYCDMQTDGGGWTVIQRRGDFGRPKDYFYQGWSSYKSGFGDIQKDFWLGNDNIYSITNQKLYSVRFDLKAVDGEKRYALYDTFWIEDETRNYTLHINNYSGDAGNSMAYQNNMQFSTKDADNDKAKHHCAQTHQGGWWYNACREANLNGLYHKGKHTSHADGVNWQEFKGPLESLDTTEIKLRSKNFKKMP